MWAIELDFREVSEAKVSHTHDLTVLGFAHSNIELDLLVD
jgi:hypothetical protein